MTISNLFGKKNQGDPYVEMLQEWKGFQLLIKIIP